MKWHRHLVRSPRQRISRFCEGIGLYDTRHPETSPRSARRGLPHAEAPAPFRCRIPINHIPRTTHTMSRIAFRFAASRCHQKKSLNSLASTTTMRCPTARDYHEPKHDFGLSHDEASAARGLHHQAIRCIAAFGFPLSQDPNSSGAKKSPALAQMHHRLEGHTPHANRKSAAPRSRLHRTAALPVIPRRYSKRLDRGSCCAWSLKKAKTMHSRIGCRRTGINPSHPKQIHHRNSSQAWRIPYAPRLLSINT